MRACMRAHFWRDLRRRRRRRAANKSCRPASTTLPLPPSIQRLVSKRPSLFPLLFSEKKKEPTATMAAWGAAPKPGGAWADDVDEQEQHGNLPAAPLALKEEAFPSLAAAVKEAPSKKKTKAKPLPLGAFLSAGAKSSGSARSALDDKAILMNLPKGSSGAPREDREGGGSGGLGGAFKDYGGDRGGGELPPPLSSLPSSLSSSCMHDLRCDQQRVRLWCHGGLEKELRRVHAARGAWRARRRQRAAQQGAAHAKKSCAWRRLARRQPFQSANMMQNLFLTRATTTTITQNNNNRLPRRPRPLRRPRRPRRRRRGRPPPRPRAVARRRGRRLGRQPQVHAERGRPLARRRRRRVWRRLPRPRARGQRRLWRAPRL